MQIPEQGAESSQFENLINDALQHRAELAESRMDSRNMSKRPCAAQLDAYAYYGGLGRGGVSAPAPEPPWVLATASVHRHLGHANSVSYWHFPTSAGRSLRNPRQTRCIRS